MLLTAIIAVACAFVLPSIVERQRIRQLSGNGIQIYTEPRGQYLWRQLVGDFFSQRAVYVHLDDPEVDDLWLVKLRQFPYIETLSIKSPKVTDEGLANLKYLPNLMNLDLIDTDTTPAGIARLRQSSKKLQRVAAYTSQD